jgi:hypothetical protein
MQPLQGKFFHDDPTQGTAAGLATCRRTLGFGMKPLRGRFSDSQLDHGRSYSPSRTMCRDDCRQSLGQRCGARHPGLSLRSALGFRISPPWGFPLQKGGTPSSEAEGRGGWTFHFTAGLSALIASNAHALPVGQGVPPNPCATGSASAPVCRVFRRGWHAQQRSGWAWGLDVPLHSGIECTDRVKRPRPSRWSGRATRPVCHWLRQCNAECF